MNRPLSLVNGVKIHVPKSFEGVLPVSPSMGEFSFEPHSSAALKHSLREGDAALDVGCSYGVMSALIGKLVGSAGQCHSLDANKAVIPMVGILAEANGLAGVVSAHNLAVSDAPGEVEFHAVPGFESVASTCNPDIRKVKETRTENVKATTIDEFCAANNISPKCIKIDVEGAECVAIRGAQDTIERLHPDLVIETHALEINGVGGNLAEMASALESSGYALFDMVKGRKVSAKQYASDYGLVLGTVLASVRPVDLESIRQDVERFGVKSSAERSAQDELAQPSEPGLQYTGERVVPGKVPYMLYAEHAARYAFASSLARGGRALDLGCGAGYGSDMLLMAGAKEVLGVDASGEAIEHAKNRYARKGLEFVESDVVGLETGREFDLVVAFEVLEHTADHGGFLDAAKRALKKKGRLVISTPNRDENPPRYSNPFHEKELNEAEFIALLEGHFRHVHVFKQSHVFGVAITGQKDSRISDALNPDPQKPKYMIAVCGDSSEDPPGGAIFPTAFEHAGYLAQASGDSEEGAMSALLDEERFDEAYEFAARRPREGARWAYLRAFAAHMKGLPEEAVPLYDEAEKLGFDRFWVLYNRGQALFSIGQAQRGVADLKAALEADPGNEDVKRLLAG